MRLANVRLFVCLFVDLRKTPMTFSLIPFARSFPQLRSRHQPVLMDKPTHNSGKLRGQASSTMFRFFVSNLWTVFSIGRLFPFLLYFGFFFALSLWLRDIDLRFSLDAALCSVSCFRKLSRYFVLVGLGPRDKSVTGPRV